MRTLILLCLSIWVMPLAYSQPAHELPVPKDPDSLSVYVNKLRITLAERYRYTEIQHQIQSELKELNRLVEQENTLLRQAGKLKDDRITQLEAENRVLREDLARLKSKRKD
ncbi:MAG: hypothetical protein KF690_12150 [Bacteroidetes bacterium]|nr:hypothetical protein [Bacteroidota bacterium]